MPYIIRDHAGKIMRVTVQQLPGAQMAPYDHPDVVEFLKNNGQDPKKIDETLAELRRTDGEMARAIEDVILILLKKNLIRMSELPQQVQDRMAERVKLRLIISDAFDKATENSSKADFSASARNPVT